MDAVYADVPGEFADVDTEFVDVDAEFVDRDDAPVSSEGNIEDFFV